MDLNKEIWLPEIMEDFYGDDMFLTEARDMSAFVENDKINLAEAGVNPDVLINNSTYPIPVSERADTPISLELDFYDTENTLIRNANKVELAYDKVKSITFGHKQALRMKFMEKAAHAYAPNANGVLTPVLGTTGADDGNGFKMLTFEDILTLEAAYDEAEISSLGRVIVLNALHKSHLRKQDLKLYKEIFGSATDFGGFKYYVQASKRMPIFDSVTGLKKAFGAAVGANDTISSVAFQKDEVMRAQGTMDMFADLKNPKERGDILGFQMRGLAMPIRNKGIGSIFSATV